MLCPAADEIGECIGNILRCDEIDTQAVFHIYSETETNKVIIRAVGRIVFIPPASCNGTYLFRSMQQRLLAADANDKPVPPYAPLNTEADSSANTGFRRINA
jgi:hypothetical protein